MGLKLVDCTLLTKYEGARTLSFKITIKPQKIRQFGPIAWDSDYINTSIRTIRKMLLPIAE